jgi:hypothetical protein
MYSFIAHPETGIPISVKSSVGIDIIRAYGEHIGFKSSIQTNPEVNNPDTIINYEDIDELGVVKGGEDNIVILNSRDVSRYSYGQIVKKLGKKRNVNGRVVDIIKSTRGSSSGRLIINETST